MLDIYECGHTRSIVLNISNDPKRMKVGAILKITVHFSLIGCPSYKISLTTVSVETTQLPEHDLI